MASGGTLRVLTGGRTITLNITDEDGSAAVATVNGGAVTFPYVFTSDTTIVALDDALYTVSALINGVETYGKKMQLTGGLGTQTIAPSLSKEQADTALAALPNVATLNATFVPLSALGSVSGVATLDSTSRIPAAQMPHGVTFDSVGSPLRSTTFFGLGAGVGSSYTPFFQNSVIDGSALSGGFPGTDHIAHQVNGKFQGGFTGSLTTVAGSISSGSAALTLTTGTFPVGATTGWTVTITGAGAGGADLRTSLSAAPSSSTTATLSATASTTVTAAAVKVSMVADPSFAFGSDFFFTTGTSAGDMAGIDNYYGGIFEAHLMTPGATLANMKGFQTQADVAASATGATITNIYSLNAQQPSNAAGAAITNAYGLYASGTPTPGATNSWGLYVDNGGKTKLTGPSILQGRAATDVALTLQTPLSVSVDAMKLIDVTGTNQTFHLSNGGAVASSSFVTAFEGNAGAQVTMGFVGSFPGVQLGTGSDAQIRRIASGVVENKAKLAWVSANEQTTVGAAGAASALPATPTKYLKVVDSAGTTYVVPAYAAA